jgi:hypothetical protein
MMPVEQKVWQAWREAQELTWREYVDARTQAHNKWLSESDAAWRRYGERVPYPVLPDHPSDAQIQQRAEQILQWLQQQMETPDETHMAPKPPTDEITIAVNEPQIALVQTTSAETPSEPSEPPHVSSPEVAPQTAASDPQMLDHHAGHMIFGLHTDRLMTLAQLTAEKMDQDHVDRHTKTVHQLERMINDIRSTTH